MNAPKYHLRRLDSERLRRKLRHHTAPVSFMADWTAGDPIDLDSADESESRRRGPRGEGWGAVFHFKRPRKAA